jgi:TRAP-type C4-dicarboxylate transport system substrate-binding protein
MKRLYFLPFIVLIICSLVLAGCSSNTAPSPGPAPSTSATAPPSPSVTNAPTAKPTTTTAPAATGKVIELRFAHQNPPAGRTTVKFINAYAQQIEQATKGRVKITMYPAESLAKATEMVQATVGGVTDITWSTLGYYTGRFPLTSVMALPFVNAPSSKVNGKALSRSGMNSHIIEELYETIPEFQQEWKDVKVLFLQCTDPYFPVTTKKQVRNQADLKGLKLRELGGYPSDMWKYLGASPLLLGMPDVYDAASKGVIDGINIPWAAISTYKFYEVMKYYTEVPTTASPQFVIMNKDTWNGLPRDIQDQIMSVSGITGAEFSGESGWGDDIKVEVLAQAQKAGFTMTSVALDAGEFDNWVKIAGKPLWDKWVAEMNSKGLPGQKVLDAALKLIEKYKP